MNVDMFISNIVVLALVLSIIIPSILISMKLIDKWYTSYYCTSCKNKIDNYERLLQIRDKYKK